MGIQLIIKNFACQRIFLKFFRIICLETTGVRVCLCLCVWQYCINLPCQRTLWTWRSSTTSIHEQSAKEILLCQKPRTEQRIDANAGPSNASQCPGSWVASSNHTPYLIFGRLYKFCKYSLGSESARLRNFRLFGIVQKAR